MGPVPTRVCVSSGCFLPASFGHRERLLGGLDLPSFQTCVFIGSYSGKSNWLLPFLPFSLLLLFPLFFFFLPPSLFSFPPSPLPSPPSPVLELLILSCSEESEECRRGSKLPFEDLSRPDVCTPRQERPHRLLAAVRQEKSSFMV